MHKFQQQIKERTGWSDAIVRFLHSREEAEVYIRAGLVERRIGGRAALVRTDIDWSAFNCRQEWLKQKFAEGEGAVYCEDLSKINGMIMVDDGITPFKAEVKDGKLVYPIAESREQNVLAMTEIGGIRLYIRDGKTLEY